MIVTHLSEISTIQVETRQPVATTALGSQLHEELAPSGGCQCKALVMTGEESSNFLDLYLSYHFQTMHALQFSNFASIHQLEDKIKSIGAFLFDITATVDIHKLTL